MNETNVKLTTGAIQQILNGVTVDKPVLQILNIKQLSNSGRLRISLSDGVANSSFAMLATQLSHHFDDGSLDKYAVIRVNEYVCNTTQMQEKSKRIIIILNYTLLVSGMKIGDKIGNPISVESSGPNNNDPPKASSEFQQAAPTNRFNNFSKPFQESKQESRRESIEGVGNLVQPISCVTPYQNRWTIKARVAAKSTIRTFTNARGEGKFFSMEIIDDSGEIKATAFGEQCDRFYDKIEINKVYYFSRGQVKPANKTFNKTKNDYEMMFNNETTVLPCLDNSSEVPNVHFAFTPINQLNGREPNTFVDVIGVCVQVSDISTIVARTTNREVKKRTFNIVDESNAEVAITLWDSAAETFDGASNPVIAIKGAKISDFGGVSLNVGHTSAMLMDPDIPESKKLRYWYSSDGYKADYKSLSRAAGTGGFPANWKCLGDIKTEKLGLSEKCDYINVKGFIGFIKGENALYKACAEEQCKKKVISTPDGSYRCEKCNKETENFKYNIILQVSIVDFTDSTFITCFQDSSEKILEKPLDDIAAHFTENDGSISNLTNSAVGKQFIFKLRVSSDYYHDEQRLRISAMDVSPINYVELNRRLIQEIKGMM